MAYLVEVVRKGYYSRIGGKSGEVPVGTKLVVRHKPREWGSKVRLVKEVSDNELITNDTPLAATYREDGKDREADQVNRTEGRKKGPAKKAAPKQAPAKKAQTDDT